MPLIFNRTTVNKEDIPRLDDGECLNDNLIGFGLRYLFDKFASRHPDLNKRVYLHNSFFYEKLKAGRNAINYDGVKSWTSKVDLLSYDYIVVPVNEHFHWWVAIICNPGKLDPDSRGAPKTAEESLKSAGDGAKGGGSSDVEMTDAAEGRLSQSSRAGPTGDSSRQPTASPREPDRVKSDIVDLVSGDKDAGEETNSGTRPRQARKAGSASKRYSPDEPRIITLDSLGASHYPAVTHLKKYLLAEFEHKRNKVITEVPQNIGMKAVNIPEQNNLCDCGVYLLGYVQEFVKDPDRFIRTLLRRESPDWEFDPSHLRYLWRETILMEHGAYQEAMKRPTNGNSEPSARQPSTASESTSEANDKRGNRMDVSSERPPSAKAASTPANPAAHKVGESDPKLIPLDPREHAQEETRQSETAPHRSPRPQLSQQDNRDDVALLEDSIRPSIELPDAELPGLPSTQQDEPQFLRQLPASSPSLPGRHHAAEVEPSSFYSPASSRPSNERKREALSSPAAGRRAKMSRVQPFHTTSHFVLDDDIPDVQQAELVRHSEPIDLTDVNE